MKTHTFSRVAILFCACVALFRANLTAKAQNPTPEYAKPLGIALEEWNYPFPVQFFNLEIENQPLRMAYMDIAAPGAGNGRSVLLLHGKNFSGEYWENTIRALNAAGYRVIVPDQIGFGKSSKPDIAYSFDLLAEQTARLLDHLGVPQTAVAGHSMGGMLAVRFARNYPQRTTHLILENPIGLEDYRFKVPPQSTQKALETELNNTDPAKIRAFLQRYFVMWKPEYERFVEMRSRITHSGEYPRWAKAAALTYQMIYQQPVRHEFSLHYAPNTAGHRSGRPHNTGSGLGFGRSPQNDGPVSRIRPRRCA